MVGIRSAAPVPGASTTPEVSALSGAPNHARAKTPDLQLDITLSASNYGCARRARLCGGVVERDGVAIRGATDAAEQIRFDLLGRD